MTASGEQGKARGRGGRRPVDSQTRKLVIALGRAGELSRNAIAHKVGISPSTVSRICAEATPPVTFDRTKTAVAVEAHRIDLKGERQQLAVDVLEQARKIIEKFTAPHEKVGWYQGDPSYAQLSGPESGDVKNYAIALGILLDKHLVLVKHDSDDGDLAAVDKFIAHIEGGGPEIPEGWA